jgi:hypothetical protein
VESKLELIKKRRKRREEREIIRNMQQKRAKVRSVHL